MSKVSNILGKIADYFRETDKVLLSICTFASLFGCMMVMSATNYTGSFKQFYVQLGAFFIGIIIVVIMSGFVDYETIAKHKYILAGAAVIMVGLTFFIGYAPPGTDDKAWLIFPGGFTFQPSELLKIAFIITFASHVNRIEKTVNKPLNLILLCIHGAIPVIFIHLQGDDGSALVIALIFISMMFAAGVKLRYFIIAIGSVAALSPILWFLVLNDDQRIRIETLFNPEADLYGSGWQQWRARIAMANGGWFGKGFMRGDYVQANEIPEQYNDFIFSSIGEELGFIGLLVVLALEIAVCIRLLVIAHHARDKMGTIICSGLFGLFAAQTILNVGMCCSILPVIGITLPFFSAGGSSMICTYLGIGLAVNVYMHRNQHVMYLNEMH
ncbi:MAG: rod shape-determining protein RodA [Clostridia bacterium]|nr:rod shape-determining protein RodA [Clostridia bacterium]